MKIVLTGGWGYRNLGDEAILEATLALIRTADEKAEVCILTYDQSGHPFLDLNSSVMARSLHSFVDVISTAHDLLILSEKTSLFSRAIYSAKSKLLNSRIWSNEKNISRYVKNICKSFENTDAFIVCGGGYLNDGWPSKTLSTILEIKRAINLGIPVFVAGPSISIDTSKAMGRALVDLLRQASDIYVRDKDSQNILTHQGVRATVIPDVALIPRDRQEYFGKENLQSASLTLIINNKNKELVARVCSAISASSLLYEAQISIVLSRLWYMDFSTSMAAQGYLKQKGISANVLIPCCVSELEKTITKGSLTISENLHGLIISSRNGIPFVAINNYPEGSANRRKIESFLDIVGEEGSSVDDSDTVTSIASKIDRVLANRRSFFYRAKGVSEKTMRESSMFYSNMFDRLRT